MTIADRLKMTVGLAYYFKLTGQKLNVNSGHICSQR